MTHLEEMRRKGFVIGVCLALLAWCTIAGGLFYIAHQNDEQEQHLRQMLKDAPMVKLDNIGRYCNTGKPVAMRLITGLRDPEDATNSRTVFTVLQIQDSRGDFVDVERTPAEFYLYSYDHKYQVKVAAKDVATDSIIQAYLGKGLKDEFTPALPRWRSRNSQSTYKICNINCNEMAFVVGTLWKTANGLELRGYDYQNLTQPVIIKDEYTTMNGQPAD